MTQLLQKASKHIAIGLLVNALVPSGYVVAKMRLQTDKSEPEVKAAVAAPKTAKKGKRKKTHDPNQNGSAEHDKGADEGETVFGIGLMAGSTATYGNGLMIHIDPFEYLGSQIGVGFNSSGAKIGAGAALILPVTDNLGFDAGGAFVHSFGTKDKVTLGAKFTPENSGTPEDVDAIRKFRLSPANYYSIFVGSFYDLTDSFRVDLHANYNKVISGNSVEFYDEVSYSKPVEANNDENVQQDFEPKARAKLSINGVGFSFGMQYRL